jgi:hypothetical protein
LGGANKIGAIDWQAFISGNVKYSNKSKFVICGNIDFLDFAAQAYEEYPNRVLFKLVMLPPNSVKAGPGSVSYCPLIDNSVK